MLVQVTPHIAILVSAEEGVRKPLWIASLREGPHEACIASGATPELAIDAVLALYRHHYLPAMGDMEADYEFADRLKKFFTNGR